MPFALRNIRRSSHLPYPYFPDNLTRFRLSRVTQAKPCHRPFHPHSPATIYPTPKKEPGHLRVEIAGPDFTKRCS